MNDAVLAAVITGFLTLIGQFFTSRGQQSRMMDAFQHQSEMTDAKLSREIAKKSRGNADADYESDQRGPVAQRVCKTNPGA